MALIGEFRSRHPRVRIWLREFAHRDLLNDAVMAGISDIAVGPSPRTWAGPVLALGWEEFVVILPPDDPAGADGSVQLRRLSDREWIRPDQRRPRAAGQEIEAAAPTARP